MADAENTPTTRQVLTDEELEMVTGGDETDPTPEQLPSGYQHRPA